MSHEFNLVYERGARQLLSKLSPDVKPQVKGAIESLKADPYTGKELKLELAGYRSLRSRRYRVIYRVRPESRQVEIHHFGPRADVYETFRRALESR